MCVNTVLCNLHGLINWRITLICIQNLSNQFNDKSHHFSRATIDRIIIGSNQPASQPPKRRKHLNFCYFDTQKDISSQKYMKRNRSNNKNNIQNEAGLLHSITTTNNDIITHDTLKEEIKQNKNNITFLFFSSFLCLLLFLFHFERKKEKKLYMYLFITHVSSVGDIRIKVFFFVTTSLS